MAGSACSQSLDKGGCVANWMSHDLPECTPACSMCCMMPQMVTLPSLSHSASTSSSSARSMYLSTRTGLSGSTSTALSIYLFRSASLQQNTDNIGQAYVLCPRNCPPGLACQGLLLQRCLSTASSLLYCKQANRWLVVNTLVTSGFDAGRVSSEQDCFISANGTLIGRLWIQAGQGCRE